MEDTNLIKKAAVTAKSETQLDNSTLCVGIGFGLGGYAAATTVLTGFVCPVCMVAAPALIAAGVYQKIRNCHRKPEWEQVTGRANRGSLI